MKKKKKYVRRTYRKIFIVFLSCLILFSTVVQPKRTYAIAPALLWVAEALVAEIAIDLGIKYVGKPAFDALKKKLGKKVFDNADDFDFPKKKPKKNGKKIDVDVSPLDRQKIAKMIKDEVKETVIEADKTRTATKPKFDVDYDDVDPMYMTSIELEVTPFNPDVHAGSREKADLVRKLFDFIFVPIPYERKTKVSIRSTVDGQVLDLITLPGGTYNNPKVYTLTIDGGLWTIQESLKSGFDASKLNTKFYYGSNTIYPYGNVVSGSTGNFLIKKATINTWLSYVKALEQSNKKVFLAEGLIVPEDIERVYDVPLKAPKDTKLPNTVDLDFNFEIPINVDVDDETTVYEIEWDDLNVYQYDIEEYVETKIINEGDTVTNNYYYEYVVNYYYTDNYYNEKVEDVDIKEEEEKEDEEGSGKDQKNWFEDLLPVALLVVMFDLIVSILHYLVRMFNFIISIPMVEARPINNSAFQWFRNARIMGVYIYELVSLLATIGLSFAVYKVVRRLLP